MLLSGGAQWLGLVVIGAAVGIGMLLHSCEPTGPMIYCRELGQNYARKHLRDMALQGVGGDSGPNTVRYPAASICLARSGDKQFEFLGARSAYNLSLKGDAKSSGYRRESCAILHRCAAYDSLCASDLRSARCGPSHVPD